MGQILSGLNALRVKYFKGYVNPGAPALCNNGDAMIVTNTFFQKSRAPFSDEHNNSKHE